MGYIQKEGGSILYLDYEREKMLSNKLAWLAAQELAGKDWHELSEIQREIAEILEEEGYLFPSANGFVGRAIDPSRTRAQCYLALEG